MEENYLSCTLPLCDLLCNVGNVVQSKAELTIFRPLCVGLVLLTRNKSTESADTVQMLCLLLYCRTTTRSYKKGIDQLDLILAHENTSELPSFIFV